MPGPLIIISGPSGSGKSTVVGELLRFPDPPLRVAVSATTRSPRDYEEPGVHYHFWDRERFEAGIAGGELLEWAIVHGRDYYGTPVSEVEPHRQAGIGVILVIDVQGAAKVRAGSPDVFSVFLQAPTGAYEQRLRERGEPPENIARRLRTAEDELARANEYDIQLINDNLAETVENLRQRIRPLFRKN